MGQCGQSEPSEWSGEGVVMPQCSLFEKGRIIAMREEGQSVAQIAIHLGRTRKTIRKWLLRYEEEGEEGMKARDKPGRPRNTSREQDQAMVEASCYHCELVYPYREWQWRGRGGGRNIRIFSFLNYVGSNFPFLWDIISENISVFSHT